NDVAWGRIGSGGPTGLQNQLESARTLVGSIPTRSRQRLLTGGTDVRNRPASPQRHCYTASHPDLICHSSGRAIGSPQRRRAMWGVRRTAVRFQSLGGPVVAAGASDL